MAVAELPQGVTERNGKFYRITYRGGRDENGRYVQPDEREVLVTQATDDRSINAAREEAARKGLDFYDPRPAVDPTTGSVVRDPKTNEPVIIGWLDRGRKRTEEWPWNLGSDEFRNTREYIPDEPATAPAVPTQGRMKGITNAS